MKFWLATLLDRLTPALAMARTVFALVAVCFGPTRRRHARRSGRRVSDSEVDHDPAGPFTFEVGRLAVSEVEHRLVGVLDDRFGEVLR